MTRSTNKSGTKCRVLMRGAAVVAVMTTASALVFSAAITFGAGAAVANTNGEHCIDPSGEDLNLRHSVEETILARFCRQLRTGEHWAMSSLWLMATSFEHVPAGFVPAGATPLDDLRAKFVAVRYVVDAGTRQERTYVFPNNDKLWTGVLVGFAAVNVVTLGRLHPLSKGQHTIDRYWRFSALHCDGLPAAVSGATRCLPEGDSSFGRVTFEVMPASQQK